MRPDNLICDTLLASGRPSIDVRSPGEFHGGHLPGAVNLPILDDAERSAVGTLYKTEGATAAHELGHRLVSGPVREARIDAWVRHLEQHPDAVIYCWRGGARSRIAAQWLAARGLHPPRIDGGYKRLRQRCLQVLDVTPESTRQWWLLGGRTGSGKTVLLRQIDQSIDLEALAAHRGSAFGATTTPQPEVPTFENALAAALLALRGPFLVLEDESRTIGRVGIPEAVHRAMQNAPVVLLECDLASRIAAIRHEYVDCGLQHLDAAALYARYRSALARIQRRLGGQRHRDILDALTRGFEHDEHDGWIERLLTWYYDPMYDYQLEKKQARIRFSGGAEAVKSFLDAQRPFPI